MILCRLLSPSILLRASIYAKRNNKVDFIFVDSTEKLIFGNKIKQFLLVITAPILFIVDC